MKNLMLAIIFLSSGLASAQPIKSEICGQVSRYRNAVLLSFWTSSNSFRSIPLHDGYDGSLISQLKDGRFACVEIAGDDSSPYGVLVTRITKQE